MGEVRRARRLRIRPCLSSLRMKLGATATTFCGGAEGGDPRCFFGSEFSEGRHFWYCETTGVAATHSTTCRSCFRFLGRRSGGPWQTRPAGGFQSPCLLGLAAQPQARSLDRRRGFGPPHELAARFWTRRSHTRHAGACEGLQLQTASSRSAMLRRAARAARAARPLALLPSRFSEGSVARGGGHGRRRGSELWADGDPWHLDADRPHHLALGLRAGLHTARPRAGATRTHGRPRAATHRVVSPRIAIAVSNRDEPQQAWPPNRTAPSMPLCVLSCFESGKAEMCGHTRRRHAQVCEACAFL